MADDVGCGSLGNGDDVAAGDCVVSTRVSAMQMNKMKISDIFFCFGLESIKFEGEKMGIYFMAGASATLTTAATAVHSVWASFSVRGFYRLRTSNKQKSWWE